MLNMFNKCLLFFLSAYVALQANAGTLPAAGLNILADNEAHAVTVSHNQMDHRTNEVPTIVDTTIPAPSCVYPDAPNEEAPEWICNPSVVAGSLMATVGSSKSFIPMLRQHKCMAMARLAMAQTISVGVQAMFQQYQEMIDSGDTETLDNKTTVSDRPVNVTLRGTSVKRMTTSPNNTFYCLMVMEKGKYEAIAEAAKEEARTSLGERQKLWQKFQALMPIDEMVKTLPEVEKGNDTDEK